MTVISDAAVAAVADAISPYLVRDDEVAAAVADALAALAPYLPGEGQ